MVIKRHFKKLITTTLVGITVLTPINKLSYAQSKNLIFNNINIEQGISQSTIEDIFQDSEGYIWLGTNDGLNRYNGYEFKIYNYEEYQNSISHNGITDITEDKYGNIWVNTVSGVNKINKKTEKISNYTEINGKIKEEYTVYKGRTYTDISPPCKDGKNDVRRSDADDRKRLFQSVDNSDRRKHNSVHAEQPEK